MITGNFSRSKVVNSGFSYIEVLISFLILSSGVLAFTMLIARTELMQIQSNQSLKSLFMADYMAAQLALKAERCESTARCSLQSFNVGLFDARSALLEGYGWSHESVKDGQHKLGCVAYDNATNVFTIGIFYNNSNELDSSITDCDEQSHLFQFTLRYRPSLRFRLSANEQG